MALFSSRLSNPHTTLPRARLVWECRLRLLEAPTRRGLATRGSLAQSLPEVDATAASLRPQSTGNGPRIYSTVQLDSFLAAAQVDALTSSKLTKNRRTVMPSRGNWRSNSATDIVFAAV